MANSALQRKKYPKSASTATTMNVGITDVNFGTHYCKTSEDTKFRTDIWLPRASTKRAKQSLCILLLELAVQKAGC